MSTEYDPQGLYEAYGEAKPKQAPPFTAWSLFKDAYGDNAADDFLAALDDGFISVYEQKDGIRADGSWPRYNTGRLWLQFDFSEVDG